MACRTWYLVQKLVFKSHSVSISTSAFLVTTALKVAVDSAETAVMEAQEETTKAIGAEEDDEDGTATRPPPKSILSNDEEYKLESTAKKARKAGNSVPQVCKKQYGYHRTRQTLCLSVADTVGCGWEALALCLGRLVS